MVESRSVDDYEILVVMTIDLKSFIYYLPPYVEWSFLIKENTFQIREIIRRGF